MYFYNMMLSVKYKKKFPKSLEIELNIIWI